MVHLDAHASISIFQLIFFTPALAAAIYLCIKHGFSRSSGWLFLLLVSVCRIAGGATQLATYSKPSVGLFTASAILSSFGISTLLLASLGFLMRAADASSLNRNGPLSPVVFRAVQILTLVGLIIVIVGDSNVNFSGQSGAVSLPIEAKVGILIILAAWVIISLITATAIGGISRILESERPLAWVVAVGLPFILIRLIYAILTIFLNNKNFNILSPSTAVEWTLSTIEECFVVFIYLVVGFKVPKISAGDHTSNVNDGRAGATSNTPSYAGTNQQQQSTGQRQKIRWRGTPLMTLIGIFTDMYSNRKRGHEQELQQTPQKEDQQTSMA